jgi:hypothetical protein
MRGKAGQIVGIHGGTPLGFRAQMIADPERAGISSWFVLKLLICNAYSLARRFGPPNLSTDIGILSEEIAARKQTANDSGGFRRQARRL